MAAVKDWTKEQRARVIHPSWDELCAEKDMKMISARFKLVVTGKASDDQEWSVGCDHQESMQNGFQVLIPEMIKESKEILSNLLPEGSTYFRPGGCSYGAHIDDDTRVIRYSSYPSLLAAVPSAAFNNDDEAEERIVINDALTAAVEAIFRDNLDKIKAIFPEGTTDIVVEDSEACNGQWPEDYTSEDGMVSIG